jgi:hypothetical protein
MSIINRSDRQPASPQRLLFQGFLRRGTTLESHAYGGMTGTARRSSVIFLPRQRKNTGKTGVSGKKSQKTPRKTV